LNIIQVIEIAKITLFVTEIQIFLSQGSIQKHYLAGTEVIYIVLCQV